MRLRASPRLLAGLAAVAIVGLALWAGSGRPPAMPGDADHNLQQTESHCLSCHGFGARHPRPVDHPLRDDCFSCHRDSAGGLHPRPDAPTSIPTGWRDDPRLTGKLPH